MDLKVKLLPRYMITFGPLAGLIYYVQIELLRHERIQLKGLKYTFQLRWHTTDALVFREVFLFQAYNLSIPTPNIIIDGGGNIGLTSIFFAMKFPQAKIYSVEPSDSNFELLMKNAQPYSLITPIHSALWNKDTSLKITDKNENQWAYTVEECSATHPDAFDAVSLTSLMKEYKIEYIDILKLDVEGAEREIFADNYDYWITRTRFILLELHDWLKPDCSRAVFGTLSRYHFKTVIFNGMLLLRNSDLD